MSDHFVRNLLNEQLTCDASVYSRQRDGVPS